MVEVTIADVDDGKQVHKWLRLLLPGMPLSGVHKFIRTGRIKVNGKRAKRDTVLQRGDTVHLYMTEEDYAASTREKRKKFSGVRTDIDVRYEDEDILIVNKPVGQLVHAADGDYARTLQAQVEAFLAKDGERPLGQAFSPAPVHRLDRNTSGLVIFAKTSRVAREFGFAFQQGDIIKEYYAIVSGTVSQEGEVDVALARDNDVVTRVSTEGRASMTRYWPVARAGLTTLVRIRLETGRTHQIRVHMAHIGHPLIGDVKYGGRRAEGELFYLHAGHLVKDGHFDINAPLPGRFIQKLKETGYRLHDIFEKVPR